MKVFITKIKSSAFTFSLLLLILSSCEDELTNLDNPQDYFDDYLLYCTFEGDAIPGQPNKALPGLPSGDELKYQDSGIIVLYADQQKSIILPYPDPGEDLEKIEFVSKPGSNEGILTLSWEGQLTGHFLWDPTPNDNVAGNAYGHKDVTITNGAADTLVYLHIEFNGFSTVHSIPDRPLNFVSFWAKSVFPLQPGFSTNTWIPSPSQHKFIITCNLQTQTYDLKFIKDDGTMITGDDLPFFEPYTPIRSPRFRIEMAVPSTYSNNPNGYILDYATIRQTPTPAFTGTIHPTF